MIIEPFQDSFNIDSTSLEPLSELLSWPFATNVVKTNERADDSMLQ